MAATGFTSVARVVKPHGLSGEVGVVMTADLPASTLHGLEVWFVPPPAHGARSAIVTAVRQGPKGPLLSFEGVATIDEAEALRATELLALSDALPELPEPVADPVGLRVYDAERGDLGEIVEVIVTGANDVWVVQGERFGEVLLPVIDDVVLRVDEDAREAHVRLLPGLLEEPPA